MALRGTALVQFLLTLGAGAIALPGCTCPDRSSVFPVDAAEVDRLVGLYGTAELPEEECEHLCFPPRDGPVEDGYYKATECYLTTIEWDEPAVYCVGPSSCGAGRRPPGLLAPDDSDASGIGAYFAQATRIEASAIAAFRQLAVELAFHGAPRELIEGCLQAARDESRHAAITARLAIRHGATPVTAKVKRTPIRSLAALARDNAVEGCVSETFGAMLVTHAAMSSSDPEIAGAFAQIAADEARHAALSFDIHDFAAPRLSRRTRASITAAMHARAARIEHDPSIPTGPTANALGFPDRATTRALAQQARTTLWLAA